MAQKEMWSYVAATMKTDYRDYYTSRRTQTHQQYKYHDSHAKARVEAKLQAASRLHQAHSFAMFSWSVAHQRIPGVAMPRKKMCID